MKTKISLKKHWVSTDGWRGYEQPIDAVCGANDTGMWSDSPCKTTTCLNELKQAAKILKSAGINYKSTVCQTSNVFCGHRYLVTAAQDVVRAKELIQPIVKDLQLLYIA
jgi:hypothetical protein